MVLPQSKQYRSEKKTATHFHSHFSDGLKQNSATKHAQMLVSDQHFMVKQNVLIEGGTVFDNIYGCAKNIDVQLTSICSFFVVAKTLLVLIRILENLSMVNI